ncbi:MAG: hypothetical protein JST91_23270 [Actinobacteria bacterium]|nr:hypothetical protein [Actinomycetota bacterium]
MALTEAERAELLDNQFVHDGNNGSAEYVRHLPCDMGINLGAPADVQKALDHLSDCAFYERAHTFRGKAPWPRWTDVQEVLKRQWLRRIQEHPATTEEDYETALSILVDPKILVPDESGARLRAAGFVITGADGRSAPRPSDAW